MDIIIIIIFIFIFINTTFIIITVINFFYYYSNWFETKSNTWACVRIICLRVLLQKRRNGVSGDCFDILIIVPTIILFGKIFFHRRLDNLIKS